MTMSCRVSISLLKNYIRKFQHLNSINKLNHLPFVIAQRSKSLQLNKLSIENQISNRPVEEILSQTQHVEVSESVSLLKALRMNTLFSGVDAKNFINDPRFKELCDTFERNCHSMAPSVLVSGLRSLLEVGLPPTSTCVLAAEKCILENVHQFSSFNLIGCLYYHHKFTQTPLQKRVVEELVSNIHHKVHEISSPAEVLMLIHVYNLLQDESLKLVEMKIIEVVPLMKTEEMCKLLGSMAEKSIRNVPILNVVSFHLLQRVKKPGLKETIDLLYVFKKLNFYDPNLYAFLMNHLPAQIPSVRQASLISGLLTVCGHLRWRHTGILEACSDWIKENFDSCRIREFVSYVLTTAALNYCTPKTDAILERVVPQLTSDSVKMPSVLLDVVWSLAILNSIPKQLLVKVLSKDFYKTLADESQANHSNNLKLLNLKGILRQKYPECFFRCDLYLEPTKLSESPSIHSCRQHVLKVLSNFVPKDKFMCTDQVTDTGTFIDAELIMDKNMKPLSLQEYGILAKPETTLKQLPVGSNRIALLLLFHKDVTQSTHSLTGVNALGVRLLSDAGYTVVTVLYDEYSENKTELQKAKYLLERIRNCVVKTF